MLPERDVRAADPTLRARKQALRSRILASRDALPPDARAAASAAIASTISTMPAFVRARTILLTLPFASEWDTRPLAAHVLSAGGTLVVPRVDRAERVLVLHSVDDIDADTAPGHLGIPEPLSDRPAVDANDVDCVVVPGVAFDAHGRRLGYGGGYYDRLLPLTRHGVPRIAGAFDLQLVDEVPAATHDQRVDAVVTERRIVSVVPTR